MHIRLRFRLLRAMVQLHMAERVEVTAERSLEVDLWRVKQSESDLKDATARRRWADRGVKRLQYQLGSVDVLPKIQIKQSLLSRN